MSSKVEIGRESKQEVVGEVCFTLKGASDMKWLPVNIPDDAWKIVGTIAYNLDERYRKRVFICIRGMEVEATIDSEYAHHIDACMSACLGAFEVAGCKKEGAADVCYAHCRKTVRQGAYDSLYETYRRLTDELEKLGYRYAAKFDEGETLQSLRITVWF